MTTIVITLCSVEVIWAQNVTGPVIDKTGKTLSGVYVLVKWIKTGTKTIVDGKYSISSPQATTMLMGYKDVIRMINSRAGFYNILIPKVTPFGATLFLQRGATC